MWANVFTVCVVIVLIVIASYLPYLLHCSIFKGFSERSLQERKRREKMREDQLEGYDQITKNHQRQIAERRSRFHSFLKKTWAFVVSLFDSFLENWEKLQSPK